MNNYYYIDVDDEITTIIGKLRQDKSEEVFLVVPKKALIAQSLVNLKLLSKETEKIAKKIVFVSPDANIRKIAEKAGLIVKKYTAKPKKKKKSPPVLAIPPKKKLSPWEEEAAKNELEAVIGKPKSPPPTPVPSPSPKTASPPEENVSSPSTTQIKAGAFSSFKTQRGSAAAPPQVIDLKKADIAKKKIAFPKDQPVIPDHPEIISQPGKTVSSGLQKKGLNPFKIKKVGRPPVKEEVASPKPAAWEREKANLTLKERERLKDLWVSQKGSVRARFLDPKSKLDLIPQKAKSENRDSLIEEKGFLHTTHRRMFGSQKIVDLRLNNAHPESQAPVRKKTFPQKHSGEKTILLPLFNTKVFVIFIALLTFIFAVLIGMILPKAQVKITSRVNSQDLEIKTWVSREVAQINQENKTIPGDPVRFKIKKEQTFDTTGEKEIVERAKGQIVIQNNANEVLSLKQGAKLTDNSGNKYSLSTAVKIPATGSATANANTNASPTTSPGSATGDIIADGTGDKYNLKEGASLNIPGLEDSNFFGLITVQVKKGLAVGANKKVRFVSRDDLNRAQEELSAQAKEAGLQELRNRFQGLSQKDFPPETLRIEDSNFTANLTENQEGPNFQAGLEASFFALAFSPNDLTAMVKELIEKNQKEKNGTVTLVSYTPIEIDPLENKMEISAKVKYSQTNTAEVDAIRKQIVGKSKKEALEYLRSNRDFSDYSLETWPSWLPGLPLLERRIQVEIIR